jgi:hypothetical protein
MKNLTLAVLVGAIIMTNISCNSLPIPIPTKITTNTKQAIARSTGDIVATILLDMKNNNITQDKIIDFSKKVQDVVNSYPNNTITKGDLIDLINTKVTNETIQKYVPILLEFLPAQINIDTDKKLINAICTGLCIGASEWHVEDSL